MSADPPQLGLYKPKRQRKLPHLLTETEIKQLFQVIQDCGDVQHEIMRKGEDHHILFPAGFRLVLISYLRANPQNRYLFETRRYGPFTPWRVQQIVQKYRQQAGIAQSVHPHLFRHQMITFLTSRGLSDAQIQLISGHESKKSLEVYQHLSLQTVDKAYQDAVREINI